MANQHVRDSRRAAGLCVACGGAREETNDIRYEVINRCRRCRALRAATVVRYNRRKKEQHG